ncbi:helix-turn-helix transcriptional regulator [Anaerolineales bacterium HSG6]|nr:helix-turn-helix transcriptional regulator [Anaerolineales bacterium HSG6]MDM8530937.1 helix-turn-helix transcriptional regulator [Anaerolineales bacterium HSG25]
MSTNISVTHRFGQRVRELRKARQLSQEEFGDLCGLDRTYISGIERGLRNVALRNIEAISKALDVSLAELFEEI